MFLYRIYRLNDSNSWNHNSVHDLYVLDEAAEFSSMCMAFFWLNHLKLNSIYFVVGSGLKQ